MKRLVQMDSALGSMDDLGQATHQSKSNKKITILQRKNASNESNAQESQKSKRSNKELMNGSPQSEDSTSANVEKAAVSECSKDNKDYGPYTEIVMKRVRALRKRVERIEKYADKPFESLNPDQQESIHLLSGLRHSMKELEELVKPFEALEDEDTKKRTRMTREHNKEISAACHRAGEKKEEEMKTIFNVYSKIIRELDQLDPADAVVAQLRDIFLAEDAQIAFEATRKVFKKMNEPVIEGVTYADVHQRLIEAPLRIEDVLAPVEFMVTEASVASTEDEPVEEVTQAMNTLQAPSFMVEDEPKLSFLSGEDFVNAFKAHQLNSPATLAPSTPDLPSESAVDSLPTEELASLAPEPQPIQRPNHQNHYYRGDRQGYRSNNYHQHGRPEGAPRAQRPYRGGYQQVNGGGRGGHFRRNQHQGPRDMPRTAPVEASN